MRQLIGSEIADFIKERQAKEVRRLQLAERVQPKMVIFHTHESTVSDTYLRIKQRYGSDIGVIVDVVNVPVEELASAITDACADATVHGCIVQLPVSDVSKTDEILNAVSLEKDIDGLSEGSMFIAPTATAIMWLLAGYDIELAGKKILVIGKGRLVGTPLVKLLVSSGLNPEVVEEEIPNLKEKVRHADVIITATGVPGLVQSEWLQPSTVIVDAGTAVDVDQRIKGDVEVSAREREDIMITPLKGGVGPLTVAALFENLLEACRKSL